MQKLANLVVIVAACTIAGETFADDIDAAIAAHKNATTTARDIVAVGYQKLMLKAIEENNIEQSQRLRKYAELFEIEDALYLVSDLKLTLREYIDKKSAADEALRQVYVAAMKAAIDAGDLAESERLVKELGDHKLPASPGSYKVAGMNAYLGHANYQLVGDYPGDEGKKFHATWEELSGLSAPAHVSLRPINWPNRYVVSARGSTC